MCKCKEISFRNWTHFGGVLIVIVCVLGLISVLITGMCHRANNEIQDCRVEINYSSIENIKKDSVQYLLNRNQLDSILNRLEYHEAVLDNKYQTLLNQKGNDEWVRDMFLYLFGIVISVLGFFGYRSFADLEGNVIAKADASATTKAEEKVDEVINSKVKEECQTLIPTEVDTYLNNHLSAEVDRKIEAYFKSEGKNILEAKLKEAINRHMLQMNESEGQEVNTPAQEKNGIISEMQDSQPSDINQSTEDSAGSGGGTVIEEDEDMFT